MTGPQSPVRISAAGDGVRVDIAAPMPRKSARIIAGVILVLSLLGPGVIYFFTREFSSNLRNVFIGLVLVVEAVGGLTVVTSLFREWTVERNRESLTLIKKGLFGTRTRRWPGSTLRDVSVIRCGQRSRENGPPIPIYAIEIERQEGRPIRILRGGPMDDLRKIAEAIATPAPPRPPAPAPSRPLPTPSIRPQPANSRAILEKTPQGVRIRLPSIGVFRRQRNGALVGALVLPVFSILALGPMLVFRQHMEGVWIPMLGALILFILAGSGFVLAEINQRSRSGILEANQDRLCLTSRSILGSRREEWPADRIQSVQGCSSGTTVNGVVQMELRVLLKGEQESHWFKGRELDELQWAAGELWRALGRGGAGGETAFQVSGSICQICGAGMTTGVVLCARCRTPHHEQCWTYTGQCSTYGCREIRFVREGDKR